jgi:zinc/manganese transport system permease protein
MSIYELMLAPFVECLILVGIHSYLGLHVIRRRVIFVDLALAQIAALGTTVGGLFGLMPDTAPAFVYSLTFCLIGAAVFTFTRVRHDRIPHEAVIGLIYAITAALAILVVQKTRGAEQLEGILVGSLLWVQWSDILASGLAYAIIGIFHFIFWKKFLKISDEPEKAYAQNTNVRLWDFLFYASFGFVITFSTRVAGVLLVFVFLVAPAIVAMMLTQSFKRQLIVGWVTGTLVTMVGLFLSYKLDLPCGPTVVAFYGIMLALVATLVYLIRSEKKTKALVHVFIGVVAVGLIGLGVHYEGHLLSGFQVATKQGHPHHAPDEHHHLHEPEQAKPVATPASGEDDPADALEKIQSMLQTAKPEALAHLVSFLQDDEVPEFFCSEALALFKQEAGQDFGFQCDSFSASRKQALQAMHTWLKEHKIDS